MMLQTTYLYIWFTLGLVAVRLTSTYPVHTLQLCADVNTADEKLYRLCKLLQKLSAADSERDYASEGHRNSYPGMENMMEKLELISPTPADVAMQPDSRFRIPAEDVKKLYMQLKRGDTSHFNRFG